MTRKAILLAAVGATATFGMAADQLPRTEQGPALVEVSFMKVQDRKVGPNGELLNPKEPSPDGVRTPPPRPDPTPVPAPTRTAPPPPPPPPSPPPPPPRPTPTPTPRQTQAAPEPDTRPIVMRDAELPLYVDNQVVLFLRDEDGSSADIAAANGLSVVRSATLGALGVKMVTAELPKGQTVEGMVARLEGQETIAWAQPNYIHQLLGNTRQTGLSMHGLDRRNTALPKGLPSLADTATIVLIDSPVDTKHPSLAGADITQLGELKSVAPSPHGTAIAELLVGTGEFDGVAQGAQLVSIPAFRPIDAKDWHSPSTSTSDYLIAALEMARKRKPDVMNLSFGSPVSRDEGVGRQIEVIHAQGACIAAAAGNGGAESTVRFPARMLETIAVSAVNSLEAAYEYGSRGPEVDVSAWGVDILAAVPGGRRSVSGTSFAAPLVAGAMLRMPACGDAKRPEAVRAALAIDAKDLGDTGRDPIFGAGLFLFGEGAMSSADITEEVIAKVDKEAASPPDLMSPLLRVAGIGGGTLAAGGLGWLLWRRRKSKTA